jgi:hypothetical protein
MMFAIAINLKISICLTDLLDGLGRAQVRRAANDC